MQNGSERGIKHIELDRKQLRWETLDVEQLIGEDHAARIIWELSGKLDLSRFESESKTTEGQAGRPCWCAQLLVSVWVYSYSLGIASARAIERMMSYEPGLRWLAACERINHHSLSDFRMGHQEALQQLFAQFLALLEEAGLVDLNTLLQDGTKVRAVASSGSLHRRSTLEKRMAKAQQVVQQLDEQADSEAAEERRRAAQRRAAREALERAQAALQALQQLEAQSAPSKRPDVRVSISEAEARKMRHGDGGVSPSYNVQVTTEGQSRMIVAIGLSTHAEDTQELLPAMERAEQNSGRKPATVIADNGYATRANVEQTSERDIYLIAPWKEDGSREAGACARNGIEPEFAPSQFRVQGDGQRLICPAGIPLVVIQQKVHHGVRKDVFEASAAACASCPMRSPCCGPRPGPRRIERTVESDAMRTYLERMQWPQTQNLYKKRSEFAEFPHMWMKAVARFRRFSVRGVVKAGIEALWVALAYNISQWMRLRCPVVAA